MEKALSDFDKSRLISNINFLIQSQNRKVGEVEETIGVSQGYLSKLSKPANKQVPSLDTVCRLAALFGVSVSDLIYTNYPILTKGDRQVHDFLATLISQTTCEEISWEELDYNEEVYKFQTGNSSSEAANIFDLENGQMISSCDFADGKQYRKQPLLDDVFAGDRTYLYGNCYKLQLDFFNLIFVIKGIHIAEDTNEPEVLYLMVLRHETPGSLGVGFDSDDVTPCTQLMIREFDHFDPSRAHSSSVEALYSAIWDHQGEYHLTPLAFNAITSYLKNSNSKDEPLENGSNQSEISCPISSEDLPF